MLVYETSAPTYDYSFALIQYNNLTTIERYNFGIILKDNKGTTLTHIPRLSATNDACLELFNKAAMNYTLDKIRERVDSLGSIKEGNISDALSVSMFRSFTTDLEPAEALDSLVDEYITLKKLRILEKYSVTSKYDKRNIMKLMSTYAKKHNINDFVHHKTFPITLKAIDLALVDKKGNPHSIATITSPHVEHFQDGFITNIFTLQDAARKGDIVNKFLHTPVYKDIRTKNLNKHLGWAKEQAENYRFEIFTDHREEAVMERLQN